MLAGLSDGWKASAAGAHEGITEATIVIKVRASAVLRTEKVGDMTGGWAGDPDYRCVPAATVKKYRDPTALQMGSCPHQPAEFRKRHENNGYNS